MAIDNRRSRSLKSFDFGQEGRTDATQALGRGCACGRAHGGCSPGAALSIVRVDDTQSAALSDFDSRAGKIGPTKAQRALAAKLKVRVSWNKFSTPGSVSKRGKFLAKGIRATTAIGAARKYLGRNIRLYGLRSVNGLVFDSANRLIGSRGYTVSFRQVFGGLATSESGLVTIGVAGSKARGWKVAYASSSLTRDRALVGKASLTASRAWVAATNQSGFHKTLRQVRGSKVARGWTQLGVLGLTEPQQARMVAFPTLRAGVIPAYEALVLAPKVQLAYRDGWCMRPDARTVRCRHGHPCPGRLRGGDDPD
jgi:hypothetical protein